MLTRCPACETHFRITPAQLKVRAGSVRCGACQHVFNALDSLIEEPVAVAAPPIPETTQHPLAAPASKIGPGLAEFPEICSDEVAVSSAPSARDTAPRFAGGITPEREDEVPDDLPIVTPEGPPEPSVPEPSEPEAAEPAITEPETPEPETIETTATEPEQEALASDWSETFPEPPPLPRRWPWVIGSLIALAAIGLQTVLVFRTELAMAWPKAKPALIVLCDIAGCDVGLPTKVGLVGIEASDLHPDSGHTGRLLLAATLKNRAPFAQTFPHLELTLTDTEDKAVARKVLAPTDYLPAGTSIPQGMSPGADLAVAVGIDSGELAASGYRLYLFYP